MGYVTIFDFPSKIFCLTVPKCFVVEPLCAVFQRISDIDKLHGQEGGSRFLVEVFCLTVPKVSVGENLYCFTMVGYRKSLDKRGGGYQDFPSKIFSLIVPK